MNDQLPPPSSGTPPPPPPYAPPGFPQNVQYVVQQKAHYGIGGWLGFWMVVFTIAAISYIGAFFGQLSADDPDSENLVFFPMLALLCGASVVLIASRRAIGKWVAIATLGSGAVYSTIKTLVRDDASGAATASAIITTWVFAGALSLYFLQSDRVKQTLRE